MSELQTEEELEDLSADIESKLDEDVLGQRAANDEEDSLRGTATSDQKIGAGAHHGAAEGDETDEPHPLRFGQCQKEHSDDEIHQCEAQAD